MGRYGQRPLPSYQIRSPPVSFDKSAGEAPSTSGSLPFELAVFRVCRTWDYLALSSLGSWINVFITSKTPPKYLFKYLRLIRLLHYSHILWLAIY
ncbi:hypothetical protein BDR04DRAFT_1109237 [Suillus decipiens]|nr:hypothetical protein BDR04DRAFT_1109237 [Suillus decipiens]